ncbi:TadE/TadG family type IV pilus assembly protein [Vreelandella sp. EE27]
MPTLKAHQTGAISIEFALSFVLLLGLFYGALGLAMPLLLSASYQQLASDALREGLVWKNHHQATQDEAAAHIASIIDAAWMPASWVAPCASQDRYLTVAPLEGAWHVCLHHPSPDTILPPIRLMGAQFPPLPDQIVGRAYLRTLEVAVPSN